MIRARIPAIFICDSCAKEVESYFEGQSDMISFLPPKQGFEILSCGIPEGWTTSPFNMLVCEECEYTQIDEE